MGSTTINADTFLNKWWTSLSTPLNVEIEEWIERTYKAPELFWRDVVFSRQADLLPPSASVYGKSYNLYHDCIIRNLKGNKTAFRNVKTNDSAESWTYERIHQCVNFQIDAWSVFSPQPRQVIAIVGEPNIYFVVSLLTALRFGLNIIYFPSNGDYLGKGKLVDFLDEIKPSYIVAENASYAVKGIPQLVVNLNAQDEENHFPQSYDYPAENEVNIALCLQGMEALSFNAFDAQTIYLHALRDGFFTLNLLQNTCCAAPLTCSIRSEPMSTITLLLFGATRVYVPDTIIRDYPQVIENEKIHLLGFSEALMQLWTRSPGIPSRYLKYICKNPLELRYQSWKDFAQLNQIEKIPTIDLIVDNALGGIPIISRPQADSCHVFFKPGLGNAWSLGQINGDQEATSSDVGLFYALNPFNQKQHLIGNFIATKMDSNLMLTGSKLPSRAGITFPIEEVEKSVNALPFVDICLLHPTMKIGYVFSHRFVLLVFVNPMKIEISHESLEWSSEIERKITYDLGKRYLPDKIEFLPLAPKMNQFGIDRNWCAAQYRSGMLLQKRNLIQYHMISMLKKMINEASMSIQEIDTNALT